MSADTESFAAEISAGARAIGGLYVIVKFGDACDDILALDGVSGVITPERDDDLARRHPGRVGWFASDTNEIKLPERPARAIAGLGRPPHLTVQLIRDLFRYGVRHVGFFSFHGGGFSFKTLPTCFAFRVTEIVLDRVFGVTMPRLGWRAFDPQPLAPIIADTTKATEEGWSEALTRISWQDAPVGTVGDRAVRGKVVLVTGSLGAGGSERQVTYTAAGLRARGVDVAVASSDIEGPAGFFLPQLTAHGIPVIPIPAYRPLFGSKFVERFSYDVDSMVAGADTFTDLIVRYAHLFVRERPEIVHIWLDWPNVTAGLAALAVGVPRIVLGGRSLSPVHFPFLKSFMRPSYRELLRSDRVMMLNNSQAGAADYAHWIGIGPEQIVVIPNAIDRSEHAAPDPAAVQRFRAQHGLPEGTSVLGSVYRLIPEKRPMLWLDIAEGVAAKRPDVRFLVVGGGPQQEEMRARAAARGLGDRLILTGEMTEVAIPLSVMSCFLLTSKVEGLPNVLLEAQLSGVRVVTSAVGGAPEAVTGDPLAGMAVPGESPEPFVRAVLSVLEDPAGIALARKTLPESVLQRFSRDRMIDATLEAYGLRMSVGG